jgi:hypothetical protein
MTGRPTAIDATRPLHEQLGCFGYAGFGSGYALAAFGVADDDGGALYCSRCPRGEACWQRHRARVRTAFPVLTALADEIAVGHSGDAYIQEFARRTGLVRPHMTEPYTGVMTGNLADGAQVATGGPPRARGESTLTWPLAPLEDVP